MAEKTKFYWSAHTSSGGTLSLDLVYEGSASRAQKERLLAEALDQAHKHMEEQGYIPLKARLLSPGDIVEEHGHTRQYWEKLLNEGKILYRETGAGRITTDLWIKGYLKKREEVNKYVRNVRRIQREIKESGKQHGKLPCPVCLNGEFEFHNNYGHVNGICRSCNFYVHATTKDENDL